MLPEARNPLSPLCWRRPCPSLHLGLCVCGASLCVMNIEDGKISPELESSKGGDSCGWLSRLGPLVTLSFHLLSFPVLAFSKPPQNPWRKFWKDSLMLPPACCIESNGSRYERRDKRILGTVAEEHQCSHLLSQPPSPSFDKLSPLNTASLLQPDPEYPI